MSTSDPNPLYTGSYMYKHYTFITSCVYVFSDLSSTHRLMLLTTLVYYFGTYLHVIFDHRSNSQSAVGLKQTCRPLGLQDGSMTTAMIYALFGIE